MVDSIRFKRRNDGAVGSARSDPVTGDELALAESEIMVNAAGDWLQGPPAIYAGEAGGLFDEIVKLIPFQPHALLGINPPQSPVLGQVWVNNATGNFNIWNGEQWKRTCLRRRSYQLCQSRIRSASATAILLRLTLGSISSFTGLSGCFPRFGRLKVRKAEKTPDLQK